MPRFRFSFVVLALSFAGTLALSGCTPDKRTADGQSSSFIVKEVSGYAERSEVSQSSSWHVSKSIDLGVRVCLQDRSSRTDLRNQAFFVHEPGSSRGWDVRTNAFGCFKWNEEIAYNLFAGQSGWVKLDREVVGQGVNTGRRLIEIAVNPWAVGDHARDAGKLAVVFLRDGNEGYVPKSVYYGLAAAQFLAGTHPAQGPARFSIQDVKVNALRESEGMKDIGLRYILETEPRIYTRRANGDDAYDKVQDGDFDVEMQLMSVNTGAKMNERVLILDRDSGIEPLRTAQVVDGKLRAEFKISQTLRANQGNLELALRITPKPNGTGATITPFNMVYRLGEGTMVEDGGGSGSLDCAQPGSCDFDKVIASAVNYGAKKATFLKDSAYLRPNEAYVFSNLRLGFFMVKPGETATQRTIAYTASTCITDKQTGKPLSDTPLVIHYLHQRKWEQMSTDERLAYADVGAKERLLDAQLKAAKDPMDKKLAAEAQAAKADLEAQAGRKKFVDQHDEIERDDVYKSTDSSGCLNWDGLVYHKYYQPEQYFVRNIEIQKATGFKQKFTFYLNPWDNGIYFGRDKREFTEETITEIEHRKAIPSRFFVGDYSYHTRRFLYNIDAFMELEVKKTILMELVPQVLRYSGIKDARKMVEHLRDGIYMMKVAIQKGYLDPRDNSKYLLKETPQLQAKLEPIGNEVLATKEYITTNMALVRVVDGMIIYPMELVMRDLRLMRVRANFMIQLETVDERLIQAYYKIRESQIDQNQIKKRLLEFKLRLADTARLNDVFLELEKQSLKGKKPLVVGDLQSARLRADQAQVTLQEKMAETQAIIADQLQKLGRTFEKGGNLGMKLDSSGQPTREPNFLAPGESIQSNFGLNEKQVEELKIALQQNDFSELRLPSGQDINLNIFVEGNSGLMPRSFVGPVIFLSNAYNDSMRSTDNLDEECLNSTHPKDALEQSRDLLGLNLYEVNLGMKASAVLDNTRQNNAYQYNPYFGSLSNLCYKNVDDLIEEEKKLTKKRDDQLVAASLKYNFVNSFGFDMDFVSLTNEPLQKVKDGCAENIRGCLVNTHENVVPAEELAPLINSHLDVASRLAAENLDGLGKRLRGLPFRSEKAAWTPGEYQDLFFTRSVESHVGLCNLLANRVIEELTTKGLTTVDPVVIREHLMPICARDSGLVHDLKYHIERTGSYTFLGGLNLNFNVGESFSMGWSKSWSAGIELTDFIGSIAGFSSLAKGAATALKPLSMKFGTSMSSSSGTSVSESTYLVSQLAKFELELLGYERCSIVRLSDDAFNSFKRNWGSSNIKWLGLVTADFEDPAVERAVKRGLMVCEGETRKQNPPKRVEEMYFYFTQHFTEGDMLDQADLYNHPWLLAMRGMRDFSVFVNRARLQQEVSATNFFTGLFSSGSGRPKAWALDDMSQIYANVLPSFPGYYTVLDDNEDIRAFLLQQSRGKYEQNASDPAGEVTRRKLETPGVAPSTPKPVAFPGEVP